MKKLFLLSLFIVLSITNVSAYAAPRIGIVTTTVSSGEEEFRASQKMAAKYPEDVIVVTYPDSFVAEVETTMARVVELASQGVEIIIIFPARYGAAAAIDKAHELYPDIEFIVGIPQDEPDVITSKAAFVLDQDERGMGIRMIEKAHEWGLENFVHYSFPRHMARSVISARVDDMKALCQEYGINFVEETAPDPTGDSGTTGTQQFILEDIPRKVSELGKSTAFFGTNCAMQEAMIQAILSTGAYYPQQCCPSPYHGYPGALGIEIPEDKQGNLNYIIEQISTKVKAKGLEGHFGTWGVPANMMMIEASVEYSRDYLDGKIDSLDNLDYWAAKMAEISDPIEITMKPFELNDDTYDNFQIILADYINF